MKRIRESEKSDKESDISDYVLNTESTVINHKLSGIMADMEEIEERGQEPLGIRIEL